MIKSQSNIQPQIVSEFSLPEHQTVKRILQFLKRVLPDFGQNFRTQKTQIKLEDDISELLLYYFQAKVREENLFFSFNARKGVDFRIKVDPFNFGSEPIFIIEAKRLSKSHSDYVKAKKGGGGIERFKKEQEGFGKHLYDSSMIGYIQEESIEYWIQKINAWISESIESDIEITWSEEDKLISGDPVSNYISKHERISGSSIMLYHFWISLN